MPAGGLSGDFAKQYVIIYFLYLIVVGVLTCCLLHIQTIVGECFEDNFSETSTLIIFPGIRLIMHQVLFLDQWANM